MLSFIVVRGSTRDGNEVINNENLLAEVESELRAIALNRLRQERHCSLDPEDLVNEVLLRLIEQDMKIDSREQILGFSSHVARQTLVDHARKKKADKRHHERVTLVTGIPDHETTDVLELDGALDRLAQIDPDRAQLVEMRFFGGMSLEEIARLQGISLSTAKRRWQAAKLWLGKRLS